MVRPRALLLAGLALLLLLAQARAADDAADTADTAGDVAEDGDISDEALNALEQKCDEAKLDAMSDAEIDACYESTDPNTCTPACKTVSDKLGKECLQALVDATASELVQGEAEERQQIEALKASVAKC